MKRPRAGQGQPSQGPSSIEKAVERPRLSEARVRELGHLLAELLVQDFRAFPAASVESSGGTNRKDVGESTAAAGELEASERPLCTR